MSEALEHLNEGERILVGGDRFVTVPGPLAAAFAAGDRLVVVHETGDLLHIPRAEHDGVAAAVGRAVEAFDSLATVSDDAITAFFDAFAARLADDTFFEPIALANEADVASATGRGRAIGRLVLSPTMRADMVAGLRTWRDIPTRRRQMVGEVRHEQWTVEQWRDPLGVVGFVFEGRPNVFADATGVHSHGQHRRVPHRQRRARHRSSHHHARRAAGAGRMPVSPPARSNWSTAPRTLPAGRCSPTSDCRWPSRVAAGQRSPNWAPWRASTACR